MALDKLLQMSGVQMMLRQLISAAAPELAQQVEDVAQTILAFKHQCDRIEANQHRIMARLGIPLTPAPEVIEHDSSGPGNRNRGADGEGGNAAAADR